MTVNEIKAEIKAVRKEMKERGIKKVSCFNGGLDDGTYRANALLFRLSVQLADAVKNQVA